MIFEPVEQHLRDGETLSADASRVIRGWPLMVDGLLRNADATRRGEVSRSSLYRLR